MAGAPVRLACVLVLLALAGTASAGARRIAAEQTGIVPPSQPVITPPSEGPVIRGGNAYAWQLCMTVCLFIRLDDPDKKTGCADRCKEFLPWEPSCHAISP